MERGAEGTQRLTLDLEVGVEPLSGVLADGDASWPFVGWIGLVGALERVRRGVPAPAPDPVPEIIS